ncbi:MAG: lipoyl domain-containing protein [Oscillospiraceae bacterium]|nr:lipoyl domain-containing protein [Oscillospiraceae bacterium]
MNKMYINMPHLSAKSSKGTLCVYRVKPGDKIKKGDIVAEIETDKVVSEIESEYDGIIDSLCREEGDEVSEGEALLSLDKGNPSGNGKQK